MTILDRIFRRRKAAQPDLEGDQTIEPVDRTKTTLTDGRPVTDDHREINPATGMQKGYVVLSAEERAKGFVRPVRTGYVHVGTRGPRFPLRDLTADEKRVWPGVGKYEAYPEPRETSAIGRYWSQEALGKVGKGCGALTTMALSLAETYARDPKFYGGTFCCSCRKHFPVEEFVWDGTEERVGS